MWVFLDKFDLHLFLKTTSSSSQSHFSSFTCVGLGLLQHAGEHGALRGEETEEAGPENVSKATLLIILISSSLFLLHLAT